MDLLLQSKLTAPVLRERLVPRSRLFARLEEDLLQEGLFRRKLTLGAAPAGYGKTTLAAHWLQRVGVPFAWLSLDEADNDLNRFGTYLMAALKPLGLGEEAAAIIRAPRAVQAEEAFSILLNEAAASPRPFILALDDYHAIHSARIHQVVGFLLDHLPARMHLLVITREDPLLPVARLRARGQVLELRQDDLRFTRSEACEFLCRMMRLNLSAEDVAALDRRTEGWAAGLQLAGLAMQNLPARSGADLSDFIRAFEGSNRFVIDYLFAEVFQQQPQAVQDFFVKTAILERMCGPLCDAVRGESGSQAVLERLEQANLFLIPLDTTGEWYRYHQLFAEFLRHRLRAQAAVRAEALHQAASRWYAGRGLLPDAIMHALSAQDWEQAGELVERSTDAMLRRGDLVTLLGWYRRLPEALLRSRPAWCLGYAWPLLLTGQIDQAEALLQTAQPGIAEGSLEQGNFYALQAFLARTRDDHTGVIAASEKALALLAQGDPSVQIVLAINLGIAYWHTGRLAETEQVMAGVEAEAAKTNNLHAALSAGFFRARTLAARGQLRAAEPVIRQFIQQGGQIPIVALAHYDLCVLLTEWNRLEEAARHLEAGLAISARVGNQEYLSAGHVLRALLHLARGNPEQALVEAGEACELARAYVPSVRARGELLYVMAYLAMDSLDQAARWLEQIQASAGAAVDTDPLYRFLHLARARLLLAQGRQAEAAALLDSAYQAAQANGWGYGLVTALAVRALAAQTVEEAAPFIDEALRLAEPEGYRRTFLDLGGGLVPLLRDAARRGAHAAYAGKLLTAFEACEGPAAEARSAEPEGAPVGAPMGVIEPLSSRELEVLRLAAAGLSNTEIARRLFIGAGTVKTHIHHICGKLCARNRTEAAMRARELRMV